MSSTEPRPRLGYTIREVAEILDVPVSTLRYWRNRDEGPKFVHLGRRLICRQADLDAFIEGLRDEREASA